MPKKYRSGFERLSRIWTDTDERYMNALIAVKDHFNGFTKKAGYDPSHPEKLSPAAKHQIRRYYNLLTEYTEGGPVYKMKPSELPSKIKKGGRKNIDAVMRAAQMPEGRKRSKYIFVKYDGETIPRVDVRNGAPVFVNDRMGYSRETIELNKVQLAVDPRGTILSAAPLVDGAKFFRIMNGRHEFYNTNSLELMSRKVMQLQEKYAIGTKDAWDKWLTGLAVYYSNNLRAIDIIQHQADAKTAFRERVKKEQSKLRRKRK